MVKLLNRVHRPFMVPSIAWQGTTDTGDIRSVPGIHQTSLPGKPARIFCSSYLITIVLSFSCE